MRLVKVLEVVGWSCLGLREGQMKDGDRIEAAVVTLRQMWRSQFVSTGTWVLSDAYCQYDMGTADVTFLSSPDKNNSAHAQL